MNRVAETNNVSATVLGAPNRSTMNLATQYITSVPIPPIERATPIHSINK